MERLSGVQELLDGPLDDPAALRANLRDLRRLNRLGGVELSIRAVDALAGGAEDVTLLDVGSGAADIPLALLAEAGRRGRRLAVTAVESRPEVLEAARVEDPRLEATDGLSLAIADGTSLPYPDRAFDIAHASMVLHHLEPAGARTFLDELGRVARRGVIVNDLSRGRAFVAGAWLLTRLMTRSPYTRHDAPLSVRRAYTLTEARRLLVEGSYVPTFEAYAHMRHRWVIAAVRSA
jgi:ubiquinone/menaquinone biosynthesis C-methylase UbiE